MLNNRLLKSLSKRLVPFKNITYLLSNYDEGTNTKQIYSPVELRGDIKRIIFWRQNLHDSQTSHLAATNGSEHCTAVTVDALVEIVHRRAEFHLRLRLHKYLLLLLNARPDSRLLHQTFTSLLQSIFDTFAYTFIPQAMPKT